MGIFRSKKEIFTYLATTDFILLQLMIYFEMYVNAGTDDLYQKFMHNKDGSESLTDCVVMT